eukprot:3885151-Amphidinium_carterae.1
MYTLPQLSYACSTQRELDKYTMQLYAVSYLQSWKACLGKGIMRDGEFRHLSSDWVLNEVGKPSCKVYRYLDSLVLRLALRVMKSSCPISRAAMAAVGDSAGSWWTALAGAANRMKRCVKAMETLPDMDLQKRTLWLQVIALDPAQWKRWIRDYVEADVTIRRERIQQGDFLLPEEQVQELRVTEKFECNVCGKTFNTYRGTLSHRRQARKFESTLATRVASNVCACCNAEFASRPAHLSHLNHNLRCALHTMLNCRQLNEAELHVARSVKDVLRTSLPKRGPKMNVKDGMPVSRTIPHLELDILDEAKQE